MKKANNLINEKSPYLLQHAYNPVDWYAWNEDTFKLAREQNKPVFLSIGYSTCHWCHVMERESFEDAEVAAMMNEAFINIKVDREERPDIDQIYMTVCQMMTGGGGWPLTVLLTPDKKPFFAGTYFPKESIPGRIGLMDLIGKVSAMWKADPEKIINSASEISSKLQMINNSLPFIDLDEEVLDDAYGSFKRTIDEANGGFGVAPKFPVPHNMLFLLRYYKRTGEEKALEMVTHTLKKMSRGGIYDHLGYGFHRYSTDQKWLVPHFEKMLYDQAMMIMALSEAYIITKDEGFRQTVDEIVAYISRDLLSPEGAFYSAEDADSEGKEGKFYLWNSDELKEILGEDTELFIKVFNVEDEGNFTQETGEDTQRANILHLGKSIEELAEELSVPAGELTVKIENAKKKLFDIREKRIHPHKDDKILTDWNGLAIAALAKAASAFNNEQYSELARNAAAFFIDKMTLSDGRLLHRYREGEAAIDGMLDDYAFFIYGLLELYQVTFDVDYLSKAIEYTAIVKKDFADEKIGGFFFTGGESEKLLFRKKEIYDGAVPSGNSVMLHNLVSLNKMTGDNDYMEMVRGLLKSFSGIVSRSPEMYTQFLCGLDFLLGPSCEIVVSEGEGGTNINDFLKVIRKAYIQNKVLILRPGDKSNNIFNIIPFIENQEPVNNNTSVYVCKNYACEKPVDSVGELEKLLGGQ